MKVRLVTGWSPWVRPHHLLAMLAALAFLDTNQSSAGNYPPLPTIKPTFTFFQPKPKANSPYRILSEADIKQYKKIFDLQKVGKWKQADAHISKLSNSILLGHVRFQRYMHQTSYRSSYSELSAWMRSFRDHPGANRVYRLARRRQPESQSKLVTPSPNKFRDSNTITDLGNFTSVDSASRNSKIYRSSRKRSAAERRRVRAFMSQIRNQIRREILTNSEKQVRSASQSLLDSVETDQLLWVIASRWYFRSDNDKKAYELAAASADRSRAEVEIADWTAGLAAWRLGKIPEAQRHFESLADSAKVSQWNASAGAYWAARANLVNGYPEKVNYWLEKASQNTRTFYGLLSLRLLGEDEKAVAQPLTLDPKSFTALRQHAAVHRAIALTEIDQSHLADQEIRQLIPSANSMQAEALLIFAGNFDLPAATIRLALKILSPASPLYDATAYPMPNWNLSKESNMDRAIVYAFVRQESRFNTYARSRAGARGLMQLMPRTASFVAKDRRLIHSHRYRLHEPDLNLRLGQRYLRLLMDEKLVGGNLFLLATAYNAGPGNLNNWLKQMSYKDDPLLFIESIPSQETRLFVEKVVTNLWVYRLLLSQKTPSLDEVAAGEWPHYSSLDNPNDASTGQLQPNSKYPERKTIANR